jgi:cell division inhibitor SepF
MRGETEMGLMEKVKNMLTVPDDEEYEDDEVEIISKNSGRQESSETSRRNNKVVNIHTTAQLQVVLVKPERFDDASSIADHLNEKRTVVLNLESTNKDVSRRLVDFLSGVAYANNGQIKRVANSTFIITPYNVDIMGDLLDELESNGVFF